MDWLVCCGSVSCTVTLVFVVFGWLLRWGFIVMIALIVLG